MTVQDLLDKVAEQGIALYEMRRFSLSVRDSDGSTKTIESLSIDENKKMIKIKLD